MFKIRVASIYILIIYAEGLAKKANRGVLTPLLCESFGIRISMRVAKEL